eukprot:XP_001693993.1 predicted protein [Chlamydomonas reinhardtii]
MSNSKPAKNGQRNDTTSTKTTSNAVELPSGKRIVTGTSDVVAKRDNGPPAASPAPQSLRVQTSTEACLVHVSQQAHLQLLQVACAAVTQALLLAPIPAPRLPGGEQEQKPKPPRGEQKPRLDAGAGPVGGKDAWPPRPQQQQQGGEQRDIDGQQGGKGAPRKGKDVRPPSAQPQQQQGKKPLPGPNEQYPGPQQQRQKPNTAGTGVAERAGADTERGAGRGRGGGKRRGDMDGGAAAAVSAERDGVQPSGDAAGGNRRQRPPRYGRSEQHDPEQSQAPAAPAVQQHEQQQVAPPPGAVSEQAPPQAQQQYAPPPLQFGQPMPEFTLPQQQEPTQQQQAQLVFQHFQQAQQQGGYLTGGFNHNLLGGALGPAPPLFGNGGMNGHGYQMQMNGQMLPPPAFAGSSRTADNLPPPSRPPSEWRGSSGHGDAEWRNGPNAPVDANGNSGVHAYRANGLAPTDPFFSGRHGGSGVAIYGASRGYGGGEDDEPIFKRSLPTRNTDLF